MTLKADSDAASAIDRAKCGRVVGPVRAESRAEAWIFILIALPFPAPGSLRPVTLRWRIADQMSD